jgi:Icc-related predicted phosphoesterase
MRLLLTSDLHYRLRQYDWVRNAAPGFDVVVVAGDHLDAFHAVPGHVQIAALSASLAAIGQRSRLLLCSGNHDLNARLGTDDASGEGEKTADWLAAVRRSALAVDGDTVEIDGTLFTCCPWWDGPLAQAGVERLLDSSAARRRGDWVWVYHAPPESRLSWNGHRHFGDAFLAGLIARHSPTAVFCGHIHEAPFRRDGSWIDRIGDTWLFNAGNQIGEVPARVEIDLAQRKATWISLAGVEERPLQ